MNEWMNRKMKCLSWCSEYQPAWSLITQVLISNDEFMCVHVIILSWVTTGEKKKRKRKASSSLRSFHSLCLLLAIPSTPSLLIPTFRINVYCMGLRMYKLPVKSHQDPHKLKAGLILECLWGCRFRMGLDFYTREVERGGKIMWDIAERTIFERD